MEIQSPLNMVDPSNLHKRVKPLTTVLYHPTQYCNTYTISQHSKCEFSSCHPISSNALNSKSGAENLPYPPRLVPSYVLLPMSWSPQPSARISPIRSVKNRRCHPSNLNFQLPIQERASLLLKPSRHLHLMSQPSAPIHRPKTYFVKAIR